MQSMAGVPVPVRTRARAADSCVLPARQGARSTVVSRRAYVARTGLAPQAASGCISLYRNRCDLQAKDL